MPALHHLLSTALLLCGAISALHTSAGPALAEDVVRKVQTDAIGNGSSPVAHWGHDPAAYRQWSSHSNRLIPVYTFGTKGAGPGVDLNSYMGANSPYRSEEALRRLYGKVPTNTLNPNAEYCDQTNVADLQLAAAAAGKKHIFLVIFDGMDWQTTQLAAIYQSGRVGYTEGRGTGLHFLDYTADGTTQFGFMVTAPHNDGSNIDVNTQTVKNPGGTRRGGYNPVKAGPNPWTPGNDKYYPIGKAETGVGEHPYVDSSAGASHMCTGLKTFNGSINMDIDGQPSPTLAHRLQQQGWAVGAVSSVPISHATPASAYSHNVERDDYQDLTRDALGLPSIVHPEHPLPGLDVLIGGGFGTVKTTDKGQGKNFVPGNRYLADADREAVDVKNGGKYVVAQRTAGAKGREVLFSAAETAAANGNRLLGFFGVGQYSGHLPFRTADGDYEPAVGKNGQEKYTPEDLAENPTLADMTEAAIQVLSTNPKGFWLMVEPGDVDWANHDNNIDNSIGAVLSGDAAVKTITDWVDKHSNWDESLLIVTADHGHYLHLLQPEVIAAANPAPVKQATVRKISQASDAAAPNPGFDGNPQADDTELLQRLIVEGAHAVRLPARTFRITKTIEIALDELGPLSLTSEGTTRIVMAGPGPAFHIVGTHGGTAAPRTVKPEVWQRERAPLIDGLEIIGAHPEADGIEATGTMQAIFSRLVIRGTRHAIHLTQRNRNVIVSECHLYHNSGIGLYLDHVDLHQINVSNSHISYNGGGGVVARGGQVRNLHIGTCDIEGNMAEGGEPAANVLIDVRDGIVREGAIVGCTLQHTHTPAGSANIRFLGRSSDEPQKVGHFTIADNALSDVAVNIDLQHARGVTISGNTMWKGFTANVLAVDSSNLVVSGNLCDRNPDYKPLDSPNGLIFRDCTECTLQGNHINNTLFGEAGLLLERCRFFNVTACTILDCDGAGLKLVDVENSRISDCLIADRRETPSQSLQIEGGANLQITDNLLLGGVAVKNAQVDLKGNQVKGGK